MGQKYSINSAGRIVAERDIYSLGGFIPKGKLGGSIADETQLSQEGECWLDSGDISDRLDIVIKDNAYLGEFTPGTSKVRIDGITELSGNTLIPGILCWRTQKQYPLCNTFIKDSFIGVTMDVACGPATSTKAFPFEQGQYNQDAPKGTLFTSATMKIAAENFVRSTKTLRLGRNTYLYIPVRHNARIYWGYYDVSNQLAYAGESEVVTSGIHKISHPVYNVCMVGIAKSPTLTPAELEASGAKILGHVSGSVRSYCNSISVSGNYTLENCNVYWNTDNFAFAVDRHAMFAGHAYNCDISLLASADASVCGRFRNIERLEISRLMLVGEHQDAKRDTFITASDCPLLRVGPSTLNASIAALGDLTFRRCVVPKGLFRIDAINGNTYEDIDFSYAVEDLGVNIAGYTSLLSSHREGLYRLDLSGGFTNGLVSYKGNLDTSGRLFPESKNIPLDGDIIEQGSYVGTLDAYYEDSKNTAENRVRTGKPLRTSGAVFPTVPSGFKATFIVYLREDFKIQASQVNPTTIETINPYFVIVFGKTDDSPITPSEFIALNASLTMLDYTKVPEITGSAYVGAGCKVRGDVQLHGDPYVNRMFDVNEWDRGGLNTTPGLTWDVMKDGRSSDVRMTTKSIYPVNPGDTISVSGAYRILLCWFTSDQKLRSDTGWNDGPITVPANVYYVGIALATKPDLKLLDFPDIPLANVRYLRAFKKRRYITNELDRKSPEDVFLTEDRWRVAAISTGSAYVGRTYDTLISSSTKYCILKRPINAGASWTVKLPGGVGNVYTPYNSSWDSSTKLLGLGVKASAALTGLELKKVSDENVTLKDVPAARFIVEFVPSPRIIALYDSPDIEINGTKVRMYDNSVLSKTLKVEGELILKGDAVARYDYGIGECLCGNGHDDAIIKLP